MSNVYNFQDQQIASTYKSVLHLQNSDGFTGIKLRVYDGAGTPSCLQLSTSGGTAYFDSNVVMNQLTYPALKGNYLDILYQKDTAGNIGLTNIYNLLSATNTDEPLGLNGTYSNIKTITFTDGIVTGVTTAPTVHTFWLDLETFNPCVLSGGLTLAESGTNDGEKVNNKPTKRLRPTKRDDQSSTGIYPYNIYTTGYNKTFLTTINSQLIISNYLNQIWLTEDSIYGKPAVGDYAIVMVNISRSNSLDVNLDSEITTFASLAQGQLFKFTESGNWVWLRSFRNHRYGLGNNDNSTYSDNQLILWSVSGFSPYDWNTTTSDSLSAPFYYSNIKGWTSQGGYNGLKAYEIMNFTRTTPGSPIAYGGTSNSDNAIRLGYYFIAPFDGYNPSSSSLVKLRNGYH
jgi:hypothetical protein